MAVKPIIIPLVADTAGLTVGIEALEQLGTIDAKTAADFKAASKAFADRGKTLSDTATATEKLATASKKLGESIVGGGITKATDSIKKYSDSLKNIPKSLIPGGAQNELKQLISQFKTGGLQVDALASAISLAGQKLKELKPGTQAFETLEGELKASIIANEKLNKDFTSTRSELKAMREALIQLEDAGLENTKVFQNLAQEAGNLDDQLGDTQARIKALGSDTFQLDFAIQTVQGLAAAFSVASGAAALFGEESDDLQKGLLRLNAAMAILNGLQQIQQLLQKQSALYLGAELALQKLAILQTNLQAAAQSRFTVIRYAAIAAQSLLNDVMAANPAGLLLLALGAVAGALLIFSNNTETAAEKQDRLNDELEKTNKALDAQIDINERLRQTNRGGLNDQEQQLKILKANGALQSQILAQERKVLEAQLQNEKVRRASLAGQKGREDEVEKSSNKILEIEKKLSENLLDIGNSTTDEILRSATARADARVAAAKKGSTAELEAQIDAIKVAQNEQLNADALTAGQREKIIADNERKISELRLQIEQKFFDDQIALAQAAALEQEDNYASIQNKIRQITLKYDRDRIGASKELQVKLEKEKNDAIIKVYQERRGAFAQIEEEIAVVVLQAQRDSLGKELNQRVLIETQANEKIRELRLKFFGDLEKAQTDHNTKLTKIDNDRILQGAANAQAELDRKKKENDDDLARKEKELEVRKAAEQRAAEASINLAGTLASSLTEIASNNANAQIDIEQKRLEQGLITQEQFDQRSRAIRRKAAQQEKALAIFQAQVALSLAILSVLKDQTIPPPLKPVFIALATAAALAQTAAIASKPIPAFKKGTRDAPGGPSLVGEVGPELIYSNGNWQYANKATVLDLPKHAKVIPTLDTQNILSKYDIPMPSVQQHVNTSIGGINIDYRKLGMAVGKEIAKLPLQQNNWDENGYNSYQTSVAGRKSYLNTKYRSPR